MLSRRKTFGALLALLMLAWLQVALPIESLFGYHAGWGVMLATLYGHATLAALWAILDTGRLVWRLTIGPLWLVALMVATLFKVGTKSLPEFMLLWESVFGQWLLMLVSLWLLVRIKQIGIQDGEMSQRSYRPTQLQFGIKQLLVLTAVIALLLAAGRAVAPKEWAEDHSGYRETLIVVFVVAQMSLFYFRSSSHHCFNGTCNLHAWL